MDFLIDTLVAGQLSDNTRRAYQRDILDFCAHAGVEAPDDLRQVTSGQVEAFRNALIKRGAAKATVNRKLSVVRQLFDRAIGEGWADRNPATRVHGLKADQESPTSGLTLRQARALLASIDRSNLLGQRDHCLLFLMLRTGIRRGEAAGIRLADFSARGGHTALSVRGKGAKTRIVKAAPDVLRCCQDWVAASGRQWDAREPLFVALRAARGGGYRIASGAPLSVDGIWKVVLRRVDEAGLAEHITPHSLRHTFVTLALEGGAPLHKVQYAAGHADPRTTERYHRQKENLDDNAADYVRV
ncbi:MAG TPA: tyrosine-type recombinase/integrase [Armatimonadota bacterium]|jgi:site-specific recombinase XerD